MWAGNADDGRHYVARRRIFNDGSGFAHSLHTKRTLRQGAGGCHRLGQTNSRWILSSNFVVSRKRRIQSPGVVCHWRVCFSFNIIKWCVSFFSFFLSISRDRVPGNAAQWSDEVAADQLARGTQLVTRLPLHSVEHHQSQTAMVGWLLHERERGTRVWHGRTLLPGESRHQDCLLLLYTFYFDFIVVVLFSNTHHFLSILLRIINNSRV